MKEKKLCPMCNETLNTETTTKGLCKIIQFYTEKLNNAKTEQRKASENLARLETEFIEIDKGIAEHEKELRVLQSRLETAQTSTSTLTDNVISLKGKRLHLQRKIESVDAVSEIAELTADNEVIADKLTDLQEIVATAKALTLKRLELETAQTALADMRQKRTDNDGEIKLCQLFEEKRNRLTEQSINSFFDGRIVFRFEFCNKTFRAYSGLGLPYESDNKASRVNMQTAVIDALSGLYGVNLPMWVDDCEGINELESFATQTILLNAVDPEKILKWTDENGKDCEIIMSKILERESDHIYEGCNGKKIYQRNY